MKFEHEKFGKCVLSEITQKQLEDFSEATDAPAGEKLVVWRGKSVRAASDLGFLIEPKMTSDIVDNSNPGYIRWLSDCIAKMIAEATNIDPLPVSPSQTTPKESD